MRRLAFTAIWCLAGLVGCSESEILGRSMDARPSRRADGPRPIGAASDAASRPPDGPPRDAAQPTDAAPPPLDARPRRPDGPLSPPDAPPTPPDAPPPPTAGADATVVAFDRQPIYFAGADNRRTIEAAATFPTAGAYRRIVLHLQLDCPDGRCDAWDRFGTLGLVAGNEVIELARFVTPYGLAARFDLDVTDAPAPVGRRAAARVHRHLGSAPGTPPATAGCSPPRSSCRAGSPSASP